MTSIRASCSDGSRCAEFRYESHEIQDGKQIMPGSPEEKALYEEGGESFGGSDMSEEEMIKELQKLDM